MEWVNFELYFLIVVRISCFLAASPIFSMRGIPNILKIGFSLLLSMVVYSVIPEPALNFGNNAVTYLLCIVNEVIFGLSIGYLVNLLFLAIQMGGQFIDFQIGFSMAAAYDPTTESTVSIFGRLYNWIGLMLMFLLNGHHYLIYAIAGSFESIPIGAVSLSSFNVADIVGLFSKSMILAFQISIPVITILLLTDIVLGLISRTVPQINVFILGMPLKILVGITVFILLISAFLNLMASVVEEIPGTIDKVMLVFLK